MPTESRVCDKPNSHVHTCTHSWGCSQPRENQEGRGSPEARMGGAAGTWTGQQGWRRRGAETSGATQPAPPSGLPFDAAHRERGRYSSADRNERGHWGVKRVGARRAKVVQCPSVRAVRPHREPHRMLWPSTKCVLLLSQAGSRARKVRGLPTGDREAGELLRGRGAGPRKRGRFWTEQVGLSGDLDGTTEVAGGRDPGPGYRKRKKGTQGRPSPFSQMQTMWQELWQAAAAVN